MKTKNTGVEQIFNSLFYSRKITDSKNAYISTFSIESEIAKMFKSLKYMVTYISEQQLN